MQVFCETCDSVQEVEPVDEGGDMVFCTVCGDEFKPAGNSGESGGKYDNYFIGFVISVEDVPKKDLKKVMIDTTADGEPNVQIVTNAKHISASWLVVVALENSVVPAGSVVGEDVDAFIVKPTSVGGVKSEGMLCDRYILLIVYQQQSFLRNLCYSWMLGWTGGAKGVVQRIPDTFTVGSAPPDSRPRA